MNEFRVGLLAIMAIVMVVYMSWKVTSQQSGFGPYVSYRTIIDDASGIFPKTSIRVAGINAGRIKTIKLQGNLALITFEVLEKVRVTKGSKLIVKTVGFLGDKYLEIRINTDSTERLSEDELIESGMGRSLEDITRDTSEILDDVRKIVDSIKDALAPDDGRRPLNDVLEEMQELLANSKDVSESLKEIIEVNEPSINSLIVNLDKFSESLKGQLDSDKKDNLLADMKKMFARADAVMSNLNDIMLDLKKGKGTIGKLIVEDEIADEVKETIAGVKKIVGKVETLRTELALGTGLNTDGGAETGANLAIFPSPERFYLLGISTSKIGVVKEKETRTSINGSAETVESTKIVNKNTYRFNIQIGRRLHDWTFRAGLIESTGGVGVDYDVPSWGTTFSFDAYDYDEDDGLNIRLSSEVHIWNVFYGKVAGDDLFSDDDRSGSFSVGLKFMDEDLKSLLGFLL